MRHFPLRASFNHFLFQLQYGLINLYFVTCLPKSHGIDRILVVIDRLTTYAHFLPFRHPYIAKIVVELFVKEVVKLHRVPSTIEIPYSLVIFCRRFFGWWVLLYERVLLTILKQTDKQRSLIAVWNSIYAVSLLNSQRSGSNGYIGPNIGIIPPTRTL